MARFGTRATQIEATRVARLAPSLGSVETLVSHQALEVA